MTKEVSLAEALSGPPIFERGSNGIGRLKFPLSDRAAYAHLHIPCADEQFAQRIERILGVTLTASPDYETDSAERGNVAWYELAKAIKDDLVLRAGHKANAVDLSATVWNRLCDAIAKAGAS